MSILTTTPFFAHRLRGHAPQEWHTATHQLEHPPPPQWIPAHLYHVQRVCVVQQHRVLAAAGLSCHVPAHASAVFQAAARPAAAPRPPNVAVPDFTACWEPEDAGDSVGMGSGWERLVWRLRAVGMVVWGEVWWLGAVWEVQEGNCAFTHYAPSRDCVISFSWGAQHLP